MHQNKKVYSLQSMKYASMFSPQLDTSDEMIFLLHNIWRMGFQKRTL